jgi:serine/threonine protein phosphatase PrpC
LNESGKRRLNLSWGAATDQGRVRTTNQDAMHTDSGLFAVADGMGGHQGGEVAANIAVRTLSSAKHDSLENFESAFVEANRVVHQTALTKPNLHGMGTTLTAIAVLGATDSRHFAIANVGDSRIYRFNDAEFEQLTLDHSYVAELVRREEITEADARRAQRSSS